MAAVTICSDFGAAKNKVWHCFHCFHCFPIYCPWSDGTRCHDLRFLNVELSLSSRGRGRLRGFLELRRPWGSMHASMNTFDFHLFHSLKQALEGDYEAKIHHDLNAYCRIVVRNRSWVDFEVMSSYDLLRDCYLIHDILGAFYIFSHLLSTFMES